MKQMMDRVLTESAESPLPGALVNESMPLAVFDALPDAAYLFGADRHLWRANNAARKLASEDSPKESPTCCQMFWHIEGADSCVVDRALNNGEKVEVELQTGPEGNTSVNILVQPLHSDVPGADTFALVIAQDISALRRAEAEALAHKSFVASIADRTPDEIYALDTSGRITWMNERARSYNIQVVPGVSYLELVSEESRKLAEENLRCAVSGDDSECEIVVVRLDGTVRYAEAHSSPLWKDGEIDGVLLFLRDVTQRKREHALMAQSDKLRAVGELAAGVAHNLNNSLTVIQGRAQLLLRNATDEDSAKGLEVITNAVEDGSKTLRRILEFARRESDSDFAPVELGYLVSSSVDIARPKWQSTSSKRKIEVKIVAGGPVFVMGEQAELREVVLNLIFNAVDAMPEGGIMEVGSRGELESGCFWVADTGSGMAPETTARIFEPFFTTKGNHGSGLGLSASHGIITRHKGEIIVVSEPGEGTRFEVRLPICEKTDRYLKK